jgi:ADP-ribose pyrophosphatase YjhB (NUDIX family)
VKLIELLSKLWRRMPKQTRRWGVLLTESRFTVTAGAVVQDEEGRILLLNHRFRAGSGWGIPGGFLQLGEQPYEAIRRELREEIGLEIEALEVAFVRTLRQYRQVEIIFRCRPRPNPGGGVQPRGHEIRRAEWFAADSLPKDLSNDQRGLIETAITNHKT